MAQHFPVQPFAVILQRHRIDARRIQSGDHRFLAHVAEQRDLGAFVFWQGLLAAAQQDIGLDAKPGQLAYRMLRRLGLQLAGGGDIRHQRNMHKTGCLAPHLVAQLADSLNKRQAFDITHRSADLAEHEVEVVSFGEGEFLDRVGNVRDHLHRRTQIVAAPLLGDDIAVNPARGNIIRLPRRNASKPLIVPQIEIGLSTIVSHVHFAVLIWAHRAWVDV